MPSSPASFARRALLLLPLLLLSACNTIVMNPAGDIANQQANLIVVSTVLMLLIIVPVIVLIIVFAWRYRSSNTSAPYKPEWDHSTRLELVIWGAPLLIIIALGLITWISTHLLDPYRPLSRLDAARPIAATTKVLEVEVVALDWKWLFIYPELGIATVNELATPVDVPVRFKITASTVMNSFYIPAMAGQIYAMPSMQTTLHGVMNKPGVFDGFSANYSGAGFSNMRFKLHSMDQAGFDAWVAKVKAGADKLDRTAYLDLEKPTIKDAPRYFNSVETDLFDAVVNRCVEPGSVCMTQQMHADAHRHAGATAEHQLAVATKQEICTTPTNLVKTN
ncbi:MAG TPA: ubiquinol oxidase subunit II [Telluria sp.]|nr:ubiquinol oxidase subunit II [Telluria sp.]